MALVLHDRVQETGTANTTVSFTLSGAVAGFQSFSSIGNGNTTYYSATDASGNWEVGVGTYSTTGPTLTRTTVLASSNSGSAVTFSGAVNVFVTYPSEKSVNLDGSGNVSALGTVTSGTWQGSTIAVGYGGTGVTTSSGANSVVLRDGNVNISANNFLNGYNTITAAGGTTVLTVASAYYQKITGSTTQTIQLPDATTCPQGITFIIDNDSSGTVTIVDNASATVDTVPSGALSVIFAESVATSAGSWGKYAWIPGSYDFSTSTANFGAAVLTNGTWQGTTIATGYGGTGLTTFTAANNALYSTSSSALTAGTLPVAAGGTGITSLTANYIPYGNGTSPFQSSSGLTFDGTTFTANRLAASASITGSSNVGAYSYGTLNYSDVNIFTSYTTSVNTYAQMVLQNTSTGSAASVDFIVSNNNGSSSGFYGDFGMNSSNFSGAGSLQLPNAVYLYAQGGDLVLGTTSSNGIRFVVGNGSTDAMYIDTSGNIVTGNWNASTIGTGYGGTGLTSFTSGGAMYATSTSALTTGTLPTTAGGTGLTSFTSGGAVYATSTSALTTGTLPVSAGGTGAASLTANNVLLGNGTSALQVVAPGTSGNLLTSNGTTWVSSPAPSGMVYPGAGIPVSTGSAWSTSKATPTGAIVGTSDTQTLTNKTLQSYTEIVNTVGNIATATYNIDLSLANYFDITLGTNVTITFTNPSASGTTKPVTLIVRQPAASPGKTLTVTGAKYTDGVAPVLSTGANNIDVLTYWSIDGGTTYFGTFAMANVS